MNSAPTGHTSRPLPTLTSDLASSAVCVPRTKPHATDYAELKSLLKAQGLLERQPLYYAGSVALRLGMLALGIALLFVWDNTWLRLLDAVFLAFVFTQLGFVGHDLGHHQFLKSDRRNALFGMFLGNLLLGISRGWWNDKHNAHHSNPNQLDMDPDVDIPVLAFTQEQALESRGLARAIVRYQAFFFFPLCCLQAMGMHLDSVRYLIDKKPKDAILEAILLAGHAVWYLGLLFWLLGPWEGLLFIGVHQALFGLYLASVFAPNHKGMEILESDTTLDFLRRQVVTARNVVAHPFTDFWYGGLNYQIEHHLFPSMPRNKLRDAQAIIRAFCVERGISYHETSIGQSYREILASLHEVSAPLRAKPVPVTVD